MKAICPKCGCSYDSNIFGKCPSCSPVWVIDPNVAHIAASMKDMLEQHYMGRV